ncbi:MAG: Do family serine endopeptidase [Bacteroidales bacterium]|nr:Do family serine endopeptidase [Bacteroidales bacterium]MCF8456459.1 Do family serine endopeptidase [Bacteroidales bacterium]
MKAKQFIGTIVIAAFVSITSILVYSKFDKPEVREVPVPTEQAVRFASYSASPAAEDIDFTIAAQNTVHGVVHVKTQFMQADYNNPLYDFFFGGKGQQYYQEPAMASGSGVIISKDGYIITNNHVISNADQIEVTLNDKKTYKAELIGTDPTTDIALLKIAAEDLPFLSYGNSDDLQVGEWVLAVGNPFNLTSTVTAGIVSAKARNINILPENFAIESFIQTDAAVNPGNSGGALVNTKGDLIGINTAIASRNGSYIGYSFAIPISIVKKVVADIIEFGEVQRAYIGIQIQDLNSEIAKELGLSDIEGVYVAGITEDGAAGKAGIKEGDIVTYIDQVAVNSMAELQEQISKHRPGDKVNVTIKRDNSRKNFELVLRNKHGNTDIVKTEDSIYGAKLINLNNSELRRLRLRQGVKIEKLGDGKLLEAGVKEGYIITRINQQAVSSVSEAVTMLKNVEGGIFLEGIYSNGRSAYYAFGN